MTVDAVLFFGKVYWRLHGFFNQGYHADLYF